jgi:hypothetical protein
VEGRLNEVGAVRYRLFRVARIQSVTKLLPANFIPRPYPVR